MTILEHSDRDLERVDRRGVPPPTGSRLSRALIWVAAVVGAVHAAFSLYWALGGRWLLETVGQWAVDLTAEAPLTAGIGLGLVAAGKLLAAAVPVAVTYGRMPRPRFWRGLSWVGGLLLIAYGGSNTVVGLVALAGVVQPEQGADVQAMMGHTYLWNPLFLLWGTTLVLSLWLSRNQPITIRHAETSRPIRTSARWRSG